MTHTECKDCKFREGDCGYHHRFNGVVNLDIPSLSSCDKYGNCGHFQQKETPKGDLISREALKKAIDEEFYNADLSDYEACECVCEIYDKIIDNAPTVARTDRPLVIINEKVVYITEGHINAMIEYEKLKQMKELVDQFNQSLEDLQGGEL